MQKEFCSNCGKEVLPTDNYCKQCGVFVDGSEDDNQAPSQSITIKPKQATRRDIDYIPRKHLGASAVLFFFVQFWGQTFILFALLIIGMVLQPWLFVWALIAYFIGVLIIALFIHNNFTYEINKDGLSLEQGVLHRHHVSIPYEQIQNVNIDRTLVDRFLGFARVSIETAGSAVATNAPKAEACIPGAHLEEAKMIQDLLIDGIDGIHGN